MVDKSASTNLATLQEIVSDLDVIHENAECGKKVISSIKNTMSDRACTEKLFQDLLRNYRESVLPDVIPNWSMLSGATKESIGEIHNFFCGLHVLVNMAEKCNKTLIMYEQLDTLTDSNKFESNTVNLIRTSCKAFSRGGDEKSGCYGPVTTYLKSRGLTVCLTNFRGNRFNIIFHNAAVLYSLHQHFISFLDDCWGTPNRLLDNVSSLLKNKTAIAGCRALGILDKILTKPLWQVIEKKGNILEMNAVYSYLINSLMSTPAQTLLEGSTGLLPNFVNPGEDAIWQSLLIPSESDILTADILQYLLKDTATLLQHLLADQLPGGLNERKNSENNPECISVLKHNKLPETVFARLDFLMHTKPAATPLTLEGHIIYKFNAVGKWLQEMSPEEKQAVILKASELKELSVEKFKQRRQAISEEKQKQLQKKEVEKRQAKKRILERKTKLTDQIIEHGLWQSPDEIKTRHNNYKSNTAKLEALKVQINFRRQVLGQQPSDKRLFLFSERRQKFTTSKLLQNLFQLVNEAGQTAVITPDSLVSETVLHKFEVTANDTTTDEWFRGKVISRVPGFPLWFNIVYESEPNTVYTFTLEDDLEAGDLKIVRYESPSHN